MSEGQTGKGEQNSRQSVEYAITCIKREVYTCLLLYGHSISENTWQHWMPLNTGYFASLCFVL